MFVLCGKGTKKNILTYKKNNPLKLYPFNEISVTFVLQIIIVH